MRRTARTGRTLLLTATVTLLGPAGQAAADGYRVQPGDTLSGVAQRLGVGQGSLAALNGLANPDYILAGQTLALPWDAPAQRGGGPAAAAGSTTYRVRPGDTLSAIASRLGVSARRLADANHIADVDRLAAGRVLAVPAKGPNQATGSAPTAGPRPVTTWRCPVPSARFVNDYGYVKPNGQRHAGVDLFAPRGTPVVAPVSGLVAAVPNPLGGKAVTLQGDDGTRYYGAHLDRYGRTGRVTAGTVIGYVGNTGDAVSTSPHLHFQMHPRGGADASPYRQLTVAC